MDSSQNSSIRSLFYSSIKIIPLVFCLVFGFSHLTQAQDWPDLQHYRTENAKLEPPEAGETRVVFMGNSITELWVELDPAFFENNNYIGRGISGQTTPQMLIRFRADVIQLHPDAVVILAGTNDIAGNTGPSTLGMIENNLASMAQLAEINDIEVVLCSVTPAYRYPWAPKKRPAQKIVKLNKWIKQFARNNDYTYCNYYAALVNERGGMKDQYSEDGVHPTKAGYEVMEPIVTQAIKKALAEFED